MEKNSVSFAYARRRKCTGIDFTARYKEIDGLYVPISQWTVGTTVWRDIRVKATIPISGPYTIIQTEDVPYKDCVVIKGFGVTHTVNIYWLSKTPT